MITKKIKYIAFSFCLSFGFISCQSDDLSINSEDRVVDYLKKYDEILKDGEGKWLMEYFPNEEQYGGFLLMMEFSENKKVRIYPENMLCGDLENGYSESLYQLKADQGPVLSFDTYNKVLHSFCDPSPDGKGYEGDYEFIFQSVTSDSIWVKGKKRGYKMLLRKLGNEESWTKINDAREIVANSFPGFTMRLNVGENIIMMNESSDIGRYLTFEIDQDIEFSKDGMAYTYTEKGLSFRSSIIINGKQIKDFSLSSDGEKLISDNDPLIYIDNMPLGEAFVKKSNVWYWNENKASSRLGTLWSRSVTNIFEQENEELLLAAFRSRSRSFLIYSYSNVEKVTYPAIFYMDYKTTDNPDELVVLFEYGGDDMARFFYMKYMESFLSSISSEDPYILSYDNSKFPAELTLRHSANPERFWFTLERQ